MPIPLASSEFNCFSLHCWGSCTWRSQQPDTFSPCSVCRCDCQSPWVMGHKCHITTQAAWPVSVMGASTTLLSLPAAKLAGSPFRKPCCWILQKQIKRVFFLLKLKANGDRHWKQGSVWFSQLCGKCMGLWKMRLWSAVRSAGGR